MKFRNLDKIILHRTCAEFMRRKERGPLESDFIYEAFADIPKEHVSAAIEGLVKRGWLETDPTGRRLHPTDLGRSEVRRFGKAFSESLPPDPD